MKVFLKKKINESIFDDAQNPRNSYNGTPVYRYSIIGLNHLFEQPGNALETESYVGPGSNIVGKGYKNNDIEYTGIVRQIVKDESGYILYVIILDSKTAKFVKIEPSSIKLIR